MKRTHAVLALALLANGCASRHASIGAATLGGGGVVIGGLVLAASVFPPADDCQSGTGCDDRPTMYKVGGTMLAVGALMLIAGLASYSSSPTPEPAPLGGRLSEYDREATILTEDGIAAAKAGDCDRVRRLDRQIRIASESIYQNVFLRSPDVRSCLGLAPLAAP